MYKTIQEARRRSLNKIDDILQDLFDSYETDHPDDTYMADRYKKVREELKYIKRELRIVEKPRSIQGTRNVRYYKSFWYE